MKNTWAYVDNQVSTNTAAAHRITHNAKNETMPSYDASLVESQSASEVK